MISIVEMSFSPTRQLSLVAIMVLPSCIVLMVKDTWTIPGKTLQVGSRECYMLVVDFIRLGMNPRTDPRSVYSRHLRTDFDQCNDPSAWELYPEGTLHLQQDNYTPPIGFNDASIGGLISTCSNGLQIHLIWIRLKMCGLEWKGSYALIGQNHPFEHQTNYRTQY